MWEDLSGVTGAQTVAVLAPNLMDRSRIEAAARAAGVNLEFVSGPSDLRLSVERGATLVIIDLAQPGAVEMLPTLRPAHTIGFGSHVDEELLQAARAAGCDEVMPRSTVFHRLARTGRERQGTDPAAGAVPTPPSPSSDVATVSEE
jgi:hypothetical protein